MKKIILTGLFLSLLGLGIASCGKTSVSELQATITGLGVAELMTATRAEWDAQFNAGQITPGEEFTFDVDCDEGKSTVTGLITLTSGTAGTIRIETVVNNCKFNNDEFEDICGVKPELTLKSGTTTMTGSATDLTDMSDTFSFSINGTVTVEFNGDEFECELVNIANVAGSYEFTSGTYCGFDVTEINNNLEEEAGQEDFCEA